MTWGPLVGAADVHDVDADEVALAGKPSPGDLLPGSG